MQINLTVIYRDILDTETLLTIISPFSIKKA